MYTCPITHDALRDPVVCRGHTFERAALECHIRQHGGAAEHPITRERITLDDIQPNYMLRDVIEQSATAIEPASDNAARTSSVFAESPPSLSAAVVRSGDERAVRLVASEVLEPIPNDVVLVVDKSGSMGGLASPDLPPTEQTHLTTLDVVVHSIVGALQNYGSRDRVALVAYDSHATELCGLTRMDAAGKERVRHLLRSMEPSGGTNLWMGSFKGFEVHRAQFAEGMRHRSVHVFTDGLSNEDPPRGMEVQMRKYLDTHKHMKHVCVHTVGYGNQLKTEELVAVARCGQGSFSHIPDASTAGTVFANKTARDLACSHTHVELRLLHESGASETRPIGALCAGQTRVVRLPATVVEVAVASVAGGVALEPVLLDLNAASDEAHVEAVLEAAIARDELASVLEQVIHVAQSQHNSTDATRRLDGFLAQYAGATSTYVRDLREDVDDQLRKAVEDRYWRTWGKHYVFSFLDAMRHELCNNFLDKSVQHYTSPLFERFRDKCEDAICKQPPPAPRVSPQAHRRSSSCAAAAAPAITPASYASRYMNASAGCFALDSCLRTLQGWVKVGALVKGDRVQTMSGAFATIECVVLAPAAPRSLVCVDGFRLTETHPVVHPRTGEWVHPRDLVPAAPQTAELVANLVLDAHHTVLGRCVNDKGVDYELVCCTLGHGMQQPVVEHAYFGTRRVLDDLRALKGYRDGRLTLLGEERDDSGHVARVW